MKPLGVESLGKHQNNRNSHYDTNHKSLEKFDFAGLKRNGEGNGAGEERGPVTVTPLAGSVAYPFQ